MKVLRDGICYVDVEDIGFKECELMHFEGTTYEKVK